MTSQKDEMSRKPYVKPTIEVVTLRLQEAVLNVSPTVTPEPSGDGSIWDW